MSGVSGPSSSRIAPTSRPGRARKLEYEVEDSLPYRGRGQGVGGYQASYQSGDQGRGYQDNAPRQESNRGQREQQVKGVSSIKGYFTKGCFSVLIVEVGNQLG